MLGAGAFQLIHVAVPATGGASQRYVHIGRRGRILKAFVTTNVALTVADVVLAMKIGGTAVTGGGATIDTATSAIGDIDTITPTALAQFSAAQAIEIETDGGATAGDIGVTLVIGAHQDGGT